MTKPAYQDTIPVAIIGAGIAGICLALDLQKRGIYTYTIFEAEEEIGGTWAQNQYPGCRCDVPAIWYSHSRFPNPNWSETHPLRPELLAYWQDLAHSQGVDTHVKLQHRFLGATWDAAKGLYTITCRNEATGEEVISTARVLVSSIGGFHTPMKSKFKNENKFRGRVITGARWPKDLPHSDLSGKRVAVIGNGCSGVQVVTTLSQDSSTEVYPVARSAHWYMPPKSVKWGRNSVPYSDLTRYIYRNFPIVQRFARFLTYLSFEVRWPIFKQSNTWIRNREEKRIKAWMRRELPKELRDVAIPDFPIGSKRFVMEDGYFTALKRKNVTPVWGGLSGFTETGIVLDNEQVIDNIDYVILSTGFDLETMPIDIIGSKVKTADFKVASEMKPYHAMAIPGIPNYWTMLSGFGATGHASIIFILETQSNYIAQAIQAIRDYDIKALEVKPEPARKWYEATSARAEKTVWALARSYMRADGGKGKVWTHFPGYVSEIWWTNREPEWRDYAGGERPARWQAVRRFALRLVVAAGLVLLARKYVPVQTITAATETAVNIGVPATWIATVAAVFTRAFTAVDGVTESVKGILSC